MVLGTSKGADDDDGRRPFDRHAPSSHLTPGPGRTDTNAGKYYHAFQQINLTRTPPSTHTFFICGDDVDE